MNFRLFNTLLISLSLIASAIIYFFLLPDFIKDGGYLIILLLSLSIILTGYIIERFISIKILQGKGSSEKLTAEFYFKLSENKINEGKFILDQHKSILSRVLNSGLKKYNREKEKGSSTDRIYIEMSKSISDTMVSEQSALEQNLSAMSTIASISTMVGLLGTTVGMIRSFRALSQHGAPDAVQLSLGISEALINTAGGLIVAILAIIFYNYFTSKIDKYSQYISDSSKQMMIHLLDGEA